MSTTVADKFTLIKSIAGKFESDRGPRPSGYAQLALRLCPNGVDKRGKTFTLSLQSEGIWKIRPAKEYAENEYYKAEQQVKAFMPTILKGIQEGIAAALANYLEKPLVGIEVLVTQITVDPVYSTEKAFYFAAKTIVEQILTEAKARNFIQPREGRLLSVSTELSGT